MLNASFNPVVKSALALLLVLSKCRHGNAAGTLNIESCVVRRQHLGHRRFIPPSISSPLAQLVYFSADTTIPIQLCLQAKLQGRYGWRPITCRPFDTH